MEITRALASDAEKLRYPTEREAFGGLSTYLDTYHVTVESQKEISIAKKGIDWSRNPLSYNVLLHYFNVSALQVSAKVGYYSSQWKSLAKHCDFWCDLPHSTQRAKVSKNKVVR